MFAGKLALWLGLGLAFDVGTSYWTSVDLESRDVKSAFSDDDAAAQKIRADHWSRNQLYAGGLTCWLALGGLLVATEFGKVRQALAGSFKKLLFLAPLLTMLGCYRPFEPVKLETIDTSEEGFLIPFQGDGKQQASTNNEEYLKDNLVYTKQVKIPQQWVPKGYETFSPNGAWQDAAKLIKVDKSPVTREWTADPNTGTSNRNEAIWVMTSDQVEFSTGWTCTARIESRDDAVKFLHNYPAGSLKGVMDSEVRAKLQASFGLEVTDLPMEELRKHATPHIDKTVKEVSGFFKERGITITNLGITGGFVYKDKSILDTMVKVFNAEQEKAVAAASNAAQQEKNKQILAAAQGKADALLKEKKAEAEGIQLIADAKAYEIAKASKDLKTYLELKQLEIEKARWEKWDGRFPTTLFGAGGTSPNFLMPVSTEAHTVSNGSGTLSPR
jgi:hypothetical protein